jgi:hypothetical protein
MLRREQELEACGQVPWRFDVGCELKVWKYVGRAATARPKVYIHYCTVLLAERGGMTSQRTTKHDDTKAR